MMTKRVNTIRDRGWRIGAAALALMLDGAGTGQRAMS